MYYLIIIILCSNKKRVSIDKMYIINKKIRVYSMENLVII